MEQGSKADNLYYMFVGMCVCVCIYTHTNTHKMSTWETNNKFQFTFPLALLLWAEDHKFESESRKSFIVCKL
jgi:hypothetical protein